MLLLLTYSFSPSLYLLQTLGFFCLFNPSTNSFTLLSDQQEMEKVCEFCMASTPVVYCKSDAAHLCLSCDAKIHSANPLSGRHSRTLLCEFCRSRRAFIRSSTHPTFMCRACHRSHHDFPSQHIHSYIGCPSANDLAVLWGFDLEKSTLQDQIDSTKSEVEFGGRRTKEFHGVAKPENPSLILQQILDLRRLELSESHQKLPSIRRKDNGDTSWKCENKHDQMGNSNQDLNVESFPLQFELLDHMNSSSTIGNSSQEDSFWQCKSPVQSDQLWSQNMQDLGVCEETGYSYDSTIPDVDSTFRNFEEDFGGEEDKARTRVLDDKDDASCSLIEKDIYVDGVYKYNPYEIPDEDLSVGFFAYRDDYSSQDFL